MVAAVFHSTALPPLPSTGVGRGEGVRAITHLTASTPLAPTLSPQGEREQNLKPQRDLSFLWQGIMPPVLGFGLLVLLWMGVSITSKGSILSPGATFAQAITIFSDPFYSKGPND